MNKLSELVAMTGMLAIDRMHEAPSPQKARQPRNENAQREALLKAQAKRRKRAERNLRFAE